MPFDLNKVLEERRGENFRLHSEYISPQLPRVLETLGFDRFYVRGEGCYLYDDKGDRYLDLLAGFGVFALGRAHPAIKQALHEAIDADLPNLVQMDCALLPGVLAEELVGRAHPASSGCSSPTPAPRRSRARSSSPAHATKRTRILYCDHAFHGLTTGALALNGGREFRAGFGPLLPDCTGSRSATSTPWPASSGGGDVAAFVVEPIQGKGVNMAPDEFWPAAQELCRKHKALLVLDEVQAGMGRTRHVLLPRALGHHARHHHRLQGALRRVRAGRGDAVLGRGVRQRVQLHGPGRRPLVDLQHQPAGDGGRPGHAAAFDDEDILDRVQRTGKAFTKALEPLVERYEFLHEVRGKGLMIGLVFGEPTSRSLPHAVAGVEAMRTALFSQMIVVPLFHRHRILTQVAADNMNVVKLLPPLIAGDDEVELFVAALDDVLASAQRGSGLFSSSARRWPRARCADASDATRVQPRVRRPGPRHRRQRVHRLGRDPAAPASAEQEVVAARRARRRHRATSTASTSSRSSATCADRDACCGPSTGAGPSSTSPPCTASGPGTPGCSTTSTSTGPATSWRRRRGPASSGSSTRAPSARSGSSGPAAAWPADERSFPDVRHLFGSYKRSKYVAEHEVLRAAAEGLPVSLVLPTFPLGPGDRGPTPTGQLVLDFLNGRMPGYVDTVLNVAHVDDVAAGQLLALEHGARPGAATSSAART